MTGPGPMARRVAADRFRRPRVIAACGGAAVVAGAALLAVSRPDPEPSGLADTTGGVEAADEHEGMPGGLLPGVAFHPDASVATMAARIGSTGSPAVLREPAITDGVETPAAGSAATSIAGGAR